MNASLRHAAAAVIDRAVEITIVGALGAATMCLTWWFAIPAALAAAWWAAVEVRLWRARRTAADPAGQAARAAAGAVSPPSESSPAPVPAGQQGVGRAGA